MNKICNWCNKPIRGTRHDPNDQNEQRELHPACREELDRDLNEFHNSLPPSDPR